MIKKDSVCGNELVVGAHHEKDGGSQTLNLSDLDVPIPDMSSSSILMLQHPNNMILLLG